MKKGQFNIAMDMPLWFLRIGILIIILLVIVGGISMVLSRKIDVKKFESQLIMYNIYNCLAYNDHFGIIDTSELDKLENCFDFGNLEINVTLRDLNGKALNDKYINKDKFISDFPLCSAKIQNEKLSCYSSSDYLLLIDKPVIFEYSIINQEQTVILPTLSGGSMGGGGAEDRTK
ncbi:hypothetical protein J4427_01230 [Candidatus Woesearchaeota archaeon]|nr:hypothetical protein [Candidatus Woesearchaeota archaeon]